MSKQIPLLTLIILLTCNLNSQQVYQKYFSAFNNEMAQASTLAIWDSTITYGGLYLQPNPRPFLFKSGLNGIKSIYSSANYNLNGIRSLESFIYNGKKGFVASGFFEKNQVDTRRTTVMEFDDIGNPTMETHIQHLNKNSISSDILKLPNGNTLVLGTISDSNNYCSITLLDQSFNVIWTKNLDGNFFIEGNLKMIETGYNKVVISGNIKFNKASLYRSIFTMELNYINSTVNLFRVFSRKNIDLAVSNLTIKGKNTKNVTYAITGNLVQGNLQQNNIQRGGYVLVLNDSFYVIDYKNYFSLDPNYILSFRNIKYDKLRDYYVLVGDRLDGLSQNGDYDGLAVRINAFNNQFISSYVYGSDTLDSESLYDVHILNDGYIFSGSILKTNSTSSVNNIFELKTLTNLSSSCKENRHRVRIGVHKVNYKNIPYTFKATPYHQSFYNYPKSSLSFKTYVECNNIYPQKKLVNAIYQSSQSTNKIPSNYDIYDVQGRKVNSKYEDLPNYQLYLIYDKEEKKFIKIIKQ